MYADNAIDEPSLVRNNKDNDIINHNLTNINSVTLYTQAVNDNQDIIKAYVDQYHDDIERNRRNSGLAVFDEKVDLVKINQDNNFNNNKLTNLDSVLIKREPVSDNELANKKYIDDELDKSTVQRFNQTRESYLKVSVGNETFNLTKYNKIQLTDTTFIRQLNGQYILPLWKVVCNDRKYNGVVTNFIRATRSSSPTDFSGARSLPPKGTSFIYIETSSNNHGHERLFVS